MKTAGKKRERTEKKVKKMIDKGRIYIKMMLQLINIPMGRMTWKQLIEIKIVNIVIKLNIDYKNGL